MGTQEYRRAVWSQVRAEILGKHTPTHLFWGMVPMLAGAGAGLYLALQWGPATSSPFIDIVIPTASGLIGLLFTLGVYISYHRWRAPQLLHQANQASLVATQSALDEANGTIEALQQRHAEGISSLRQQHAHAIEALRREYESAILTVTAFTDSLSQWMPHGPLDRTKNVYLDRRFAILKVTNEGHNNLPGIVATCQFVGGSGKCVWSLETGEPFALEGSDTADLNVGATRLLIVAQGFGAESLWARLPTAAKPLNDVPFLVREASLGVSSRAHFLDHSGGEILDLGADVLVSVRMKGVGVDQTQRFRLWFNQGKPVIDAYS